MTEQQRYQVVRESGGFELREYEPHVLAEVRVRGAFESAGSTAFRPLVSYIGGRNASGQKIAMTAPVIQAPDATGTEHEVAFVMPAGSTLAAMPEPTDAGVSMREVGTELVAAVRFSGRWSEGVFAERSAALLGWVRDEGLEPTGPPRFARYDPPWTPWFLRRNEVLIPVTGDSSPDGGQTPRAAATS